MSRQRARGRLRAEVAGGGACTDDGYRLAAYRRWCEANGQLLEPPARPWPADYPGPTQVLLRFLHSEYPKWAANTVGMYLWVVVGELKRQGHGGDIDDALLRRYRRRVTDELGETRLRPVDALTKEQVKAAPARAEEEVHPLSSESVRLRGVIAVADALRVDPTDPGYVLQRLHRDAFDRRHDGIVITAAPRPTCQFPGCERPVCPETGSTPRRYCEQWDDAAGRVHNSLSVRWARRQATAQVPGRAAKHGRPSRNRVLLDAARQPEMHAALIAALDAAGDAEFPLAAPVEGRGELPTWEGVRKDRESLFSGWARAFPSTAPRPDKSHRPPAEQLRAGIAASTAEDRLWWLAQMDRWLWLRRRDAAYLLCGVLTARRHIELERAALGDLTITDDGGYTYVVRDHKGNRLTRLRGGKEEPLTRTIGHRTVCGVDCPACAMRAHLEVRRRSGAPDEAPLFVGVDGTALGREGGSHVIKRLAALVEDMDDNPDGAPRSYSSRTLRATGATVARLAGMSYREIGDEVTGHRSEDQVALYVRRHGVDLADLVLRLDGTTRHKATGDG